MSAESRRIRQQRDPLVRYLGAELIEAALGIPEADVIAWGEGDTRVTPADPIAERCLYLAFEHVARTYGLADAHAWFTAENAGLSGVTPVAALRQGQPIPVPLAAGDDTPFERVDLSALDLNGQLRVGLAGDWHGNLWHAERSLKKFSAAGICSILHLGDFGLWPGNSGAKFIRRVDTACAWHGVTIQISDGNHEDHSRLDQIEPVDGVRWVTDYIGFFERGHRWAWGDTTFLSIGGAPSVDKDRRAAGSSWWPQEAITDADVAKAVEGGHADVMLSHDAPIPGTKAVQNIIDSPAPWSPEALKYAAEGRARITAVFEAVHPSVLIHGHFHAVDRATVRIPGADHDTDVVSLACDGMDGNLATLDIDTLEVTIL